MKYNHAFSVCFSLESEHPEGCDLTAEQIRDAIMRRVRTAYESNELHEAIGAPYDTYEIEGNTGERDFDIAAYGDECQAEDRGVREDIQNEIKRMLDLNKFPVVNAQGLALIKAWVKQTTKHDAFGPAHDVGPRSLDAWCIEAEESALNGNLPLIEMQAISTRSGRTETLLLDLLHLDFVDQERNTDEN